MPAEADIPHHNQRRHAEASSRPQHPAAAEDPDGYARWKGRLDRALALVFLLLSAPVVLPALILVKLTSRGPVFYSQFRLGLGGRPFTIYKIRTMLHNCETWSGVRWCTPGDPRVTWPGRFLRWTHVDELPQLWNVLRGEMSLVGPRPERPDFIPLLERMIPCYRERLRVRPGLTGLAQVQLPADTDLASVRRKLAYDLYYVHHLGLGLDLKILLATAGLLLRLPAVVSRRLLRVPGGEPVDRAYRSLAARLCAAPVTPAVPSGSNQDIGTGPSGSPNPGRSAGATENGRAGDWLAFGDATTGGSRSSSTG